MKDIQPHTANRFHVLGLTRSHIVHHGNSSSSITNDTEFVDMYVRTDYTTESLKYCSAISLATNTTIEAPRKGQKYLNLVNYLVGMLLSL